ncbi:hypothetical protein HK097_001591 [Rhizophlyctis rosea]|uniref:Uncharacterized protein n=1 Tax=Rhizophlyctis rosea TaxID=64517 RepID=A0AAD5X1S5_9FUNG|nr:hypothetical protein HK097_001591 [Rhizophlyctis rosea]
MKGALREENFLQLLCKIFNTNAYKLVKLTEPPFSPFASFNETPHAPQQTILPQSPELTLRVGAYALRPLDAGTPELKLVDRKIEPIVPKDSPRTAQEAEITTEQEGAVKKQKTNGASTPLGTRAGSLESLADRDHSKDVKKDSAKSNRNDAFKARLLSVIRTAPSPKDFNSLEGTHVLDVDW